MIEVYSWATPNGHKVHIMLEECALPYKVTAVDIGKGEQFQSNFLAISPNNKIPAIVDPEGPEGKPISIFESGAILFYLACKTGQFLPEKLADRYAMMEWLMFQMGGIGPMLGQAHHFRQYAPQKIPYAIDRYTNEARRLYGVLDRRLEKSEYVACDEFSIADIAIYPWLRSAERQGVDWEEFPHAWRWFQQISQRPAVQRGVKVLSDVHRPIESAQDREVLFGAEQYRRR